MLTEKQIHNIRKLDKETLQQIMHECAEVLGLVDVEEASEVLMIAKRTLYDKMKSGAIGKFIIGKHIFPLINIIKA